MSPVHLAAYWQSVDPAGAFVDIPAIADQRLQTNVNNIRVPALNNIGFLAAGYEGVTAPRGRIYSPSIEQFARYEIAPGNTVNAAGVVPESPPKFVDLRRNPIPLDVDENLRFELLSNPAAVQAQWLLVWFCDGPIAPVEANAVYSVRFTSATALVAGAWTDCILAIDDELPVGVYSVVGMRAFSATCLAARLNFIGTDQSWRPGVMGFANGLQNDLGLFRKGYMGEFGKFATTSLPHAEFLANAADAAETVLLDVVKVG